MKRFFLLIFSIFTIFTIFFVGEQVDAASFNLSSSTNQVSANATFTIKVGGDCIGRVDLKVSNGTLSQSSVWVEQGYVSVSVKANSSGVVTVTAIPVTGFSDSDANIYNPGSRSVTVRIVAQGNTSSSINKPNNGGAVSNGGTVSKKSGNNNLSSLTVSEGKLSPKFVSSNTTYSLKLSELVKEINVSAKTDSNKAKVSGLGNISLQPGDNKIEILVTAENGDKKVYTINAYVDPKPLVYLKYNNEKIGIVRNFKDIYIPKDFVKSNYEIDNNTITLFSKDNINLVYGEDSQNEKILYLFDKEHNNLVKKVTPVNINNREFLVVDVNKTKDGFVLDEFEVDNKKIGCYIFENPDYYLINVLNGNGKIVEYLYEKSEGTIQLFPGFLLNKKDENINNLPIYILGAIVAILCILVIFLGLKLKKGGKHDKKR